MFISPLTSGHDCFPLPSCLPAYPFPVHMVFVSRRHTKPGAIFPSLRLSRSGRAKKKKQNRRLRCSKLYISPSLLCCFAFFYFPEINKVSQTGDYDYSDHSSSASSNYTYMHDWICSAVGWRCSFSLLSGLLTNFVPYLCSWEDARRHSGLIQWSQLHL